MFSSCSPRVSYADLAHRMLASVTNNRAQNGTPKLKCTPLMRKKPFPPAGALSRVSAFTLLKLFLVGISGSAPKNSNDRRRPVLGHACSPSFCRANKSCRLRGTVDDDDGPSTCRKCDDAFPLFVFQRQCVLASSTRPTSFRPMQREIRKVWQQQQ